TPGVEHITAAQIADERQERRVVVKFPGDVLAVANLFRPPGGVVVPVASDVVVGEFSFAQRAATPSGERVRYHGTRLVRPASSTIVSAQQVHAFPREILPDGWSFGGILDRLISLRSPEARDEPAAGGGGVHPYARPVRGDHLAHP